MTDSQLIPVFINLLKREQAEIAESAMLRPKHDLFVLGEAAGNYQGLQKALDILEAILSDEVQLEKNS